MKTMKLWKVLARNSHVYQKEKRPNCDDQFADYEDRGVQHRHHIQLRKRKGETLGIVVATPGSGDLEQQCPSIASLRPGSVALASDQLTPGDRICSVNGINTSRMRPEDVATLLDNVDGNATLEIQYELPNYVSQNSLCTTTKIAEITIERTDGSLGMTLRGGAVPDAPHLCRPLIITHIRPDGPAHRTGLIRVGDRLLKIDHQPLVGKTLHEAQQLLTARPHALSRLTIEYDVSIIESVRYANGPLLVEIDRDCEEEFGLVLTDCCELGPDDILVAGFYVESILPASTADRCGALGVGDRLLAIDDISMEGFNGSTHDAQKMLRTARKLQILPAHTFERSPSRNYNLSGTYGSLNSRQSRNRRNRHSIFFNKPTESECGSNHYNCPSTTTTSNNGVSHPERLTLTLIADRGVGYGLNVAVDEHEDDDVERVGDILITKIIQDSPAHRTGRLQSGDRLIALNHRHTLTIQEIEALLEHGRELSNPQKLVIETEFDVADTIVPSSGIFTVKLAKKRGVPDLGITITASKTQPDEPFIISEIKRGSIAHRTGTLHAGDRLLAIDNRPLEHATLENVFESLRTQEIVTLKIEKTETENSNLFLDSVVYTVELHRYGGPLGITISGSEDCLEPIILTRLTEGGLAEKTGALHPGDRILAINGETLDRRPLSDAIRLLRNSGDRVQLKIARELNDSRLDYSSPGVTSVDSAVHSWDGNAIECKDGDSVCSEALSLYRDDKTGGQDSRLQFYSDSDEVFCPSPLPLPNYKFDGIYESRIKGSYSDESILDNEIYHVTLYKDSIYDDYGFSVSDGLYEKGVYVNRIRKGGPADIVGLLKPYDRIIQVNDTKTKDFDCCLTVPLIASAGDRLELVIARNPFINVDMMDDVSKKMFTSSQNTITKTL